MDKLRLVDLLYIGIGLLIYLYLSSGMAAAHARQAWRVLDRRGTPRTRVMSRPQTRRRALPTRSVYIPVSRYGMEPAGMAAPPPPPAPAAPDIDAPKPGMLQISRDISDDNLIAVLAVLRKDGKPRYSANDIFKIVGGDRNTVLAKVKEIREGPAQPVYPPRTAEQKGAREQLGLPA